MEKDRLQGIRNVCFFCGERYGKVISKNVGVWKEKCDICGRYRICTSPRDFGYLRYYKGKKKNG